MIHEKIKNLNLTEGEIWTLQYAIHCARADLEKKKKEKLTAEWKNEDSTTHDLHIKNLWNFTEKVKN